MYVTAGAGSTCRLHSQNCTVTDKTGRLKDFSSVLFF